MRSASLQLSLLSVITYIFITIPTASVHSQDNNNYESGQELTDDISRGDLFQRIRTETIAQDAMQDDTKWFNLYGPFAFPNDAIFDVVEGHKRANSFFVADISHYTDANIPLESFSAKKIKAVYVKASQKKGRDGKFSTFWTRLGNLKGAERVHRGAYHFLSANFSAVDQCSFFSDILKQNELKETDLPPVIDLEWDVTRSDGPDAWANTSATDIVQAAVDCLETVKKETGRIPMVYTAVSFLNDRHIDKKAYAKLAQYPVWIADYSRRSRASEVPRVLQGMRAPLWQFTDSAKLAVGYSAGFDASIFKGTEEGFYRDLGVERFK